MRHRRAWAKNTFESHAILYRSPKAVAAFLVFGTEQQQQQQQQATDGATVNCMAENK